MKLSNIVIKGQKQPVTVTDDPADALVLEERYLLTGDTRGFATSYDVPLDNNKLVEFVFEDETTWLCSNTSIEELFPQAATARSAGTAFEVPLTLRSPANDRGIVQDIAVKLVNIFVKKKVNTTVEKAAKNFELKNLGNKVGLFRVDAALQLLNFKELQPGKPCLLLIHGTASSTVGCFEGLKNTDLWRFITQTYGTNIIAFQHETLSKSPLQNIRELLPQLPDEADFHIISHSRGGILGDILCRFTNTDAAHRGFTSEEMDFLLKEDRHSDLHEIKEIGLLLKKKNLRVSRFIRVASPASGTILASKRMDIYFNIIANLTGLVTGMMANPVYAAFKNLIAAVIDTKDNTDVLPGIEAMNPESPFIKALNNPSTTALTDVPLAVIAGNCGINFSLKALKIIAVRLFFLEANDLVVNSDSMYLGSKRKAPIQYFLDDADDVDHFSYFRNRKTGQAILRALQVQPNQLIPGFSLFNQPSSEEALRNAVFNPEGGELDPGVITGKRPIAVLLPGIMGSNIGPKGDLLWINYWKFISGGLGDLNNLQKYTATSVVKTSYKKLKDHLSESYDVETFHFDWRLSLEKVAAVFNARIKELMALHQPIKIIGHSMGGVVIRDFMVHHRDTWQQLNQSAGFRLVFLGSPLGGSYRIPYVLFGKDSIIKKLSLLDIKHSKKELLRVFSGIQGLLSLLPLEKNNPDHDFSLPQTWKKMAAALGDASWPIPPDAALRIFADYRNALPPELLPDDYRNAVYIAGKDKSTPCGYRIEDEGLVFLSTAEGDQSVTWETGIPKTMIAANSVYYVNVSHGALANEPSLFRGIDDLLLKGETTLLSKKRPVVRGEEKVFRSPETFDFDTSMIGVEKTLLGLSSGAASAETGETPLSVSVSNGDLLYSNHFLLAGHFEDDGVLYAESAIDHHLDGALKKRHQLGLYPGKIGSSEVALPVNDKFKGAIIVGLGKPGTLTAYQLTQTVEQGVSNYLLGLNNTQLGARKKDQTAGISSLIIGCGYGGLTVENSVRAILQGVQNANLKVRKIHGSHCRVVEEVEFVEKDHSRALGCFYSLSRIENEQSRSLNILLPEKKIKLLLGRTKRMPHDATEEWWNRITIRNTHPTEKGVVKSLQFSASTGGAREEQRTLQSSVGIVEELISSISTNNQWSPQLAKTIFELLIPNDFKEQLKKQCNISWILDEETASYPWELLQDSVLNAKPLCISAGMIRQLTTENYRVTVKPAAKNNALIIAEPALHGFAPPLPAALEEGKLVEEILLGRDFETKSILEGNPPEIIQALFEDDYRIIHLAGHGVFNPETPDHSGMLIGNNVYLSTREIAQMSVVPELVFVNCCFLGKTSGAAEELYQQRFRLAANIGTQLIRNGVKAVIAAGWAVNDAAALEFTKVFYQSMFAGYNFGESVHKARKQVYDNFPESNTWGAYQCYGDPFFKLQMKSPEKKQETFSYVISEEAEYDLYNLLNELEMGKKQVPEYLARLNAISEAVEKAGIRNAEITEKEAWVLTELGELDPAIACYARLLKMEKALFTFLSMEKFCDIRGRKAVRDFYAETKSSRQALQEMDTVISDLEVLISAGGTAERFSLLARSYKRKALLFPQKKDRKQALEMAAWYYKKAYDSPTLLNNVYVLTNWLEIESMMVLMHGRAWGKPAKAGHQEYVLPSLLEAMEMLKEQAIALGNIGEELDYHDMVAVAYIKMSLLLMSRKAGREPEKWQDLTLSFKKIWDKAGSPGKKAAEIETLQFLVMILSDEQGDSSFAELLKEKPNAEQVPFYLEKLRASLLQYAPASAGTKATVPVKKVAPVTKSNPVTKTTPPTPAKTAPTKKAAPKKIPVKQAPAKKGTAKR